MNNQPDFNYTQFDKNFYLKVTFEMRTMPSSICNIVSSIRLYIYEKITWFYL